MMGDADKGCWNADLLIWIPNTKEKAGLFFLAAKEGQEHLYLSVAQDFLNLYILISEYFKVSRMYVTWHGLAIPCCSGKNSDPSCHFVLTKWAVEFFCLFVLNYRNCISFFWIFFFFMCINLTEKHKRKRMQYFGQL